MTPAPTRWFQRWGAPVATLALAAAAAAVPTLKHVTYVKPIIQTLPAKDITQVVIQNLVGPIAVNTVDGDDIKIEAVVHTGGDDEVFARTLADQLKLEITPVNGQLRIMAHYPLDHFQNYGYPNMKSIVGIHGTDSNEYEGQRVYIRAVGSNKAIEMWTEIRVTMPSRMAVVVRNTYGDVQIQGDGPASDGSFDGFTDVGDFSIRNPRWAKIKLVSDYGKVEFRDGFGAASDIDVNTDVGGTTFYLPAGATGQIVASKDLGFLHNDFTDSRFTKDNDGNSVMLLGDGKGTTVHVEMSVGSLHLKRVGDAPLDY